jgi:hypothetical protein
LLLLLLPFELRGIGAIDEVICAIQFVWCESATVQVANENDLGSTALAQVRPAHMLHQGLKITLEVQEPPVEQL